MKYPSLSSMPVDSLILMARQKDNEDFTLYVKQIILDYYLSNILFVELLNLYRSAKGLKRKILANAIAIRLVDEIYLIDIENLKTILKEADIEYLWVLSKSCKIEIIKSLSFLSIIIRLEEIEEDADLNSELQQKIVNDTLYLNRVKPGFNGGVHNE